MNPNIGLTFHQRRGIWRTHQGSVGYECLRAPEDERQYETSLTTFFLLQMYKMRENYLKDVHSETIGVVQWVVHSS